MPEIHTLTFPYIKVKGQPLSPEVVEALQDVTVESNFFMPNMVTLHLVDNDIKLVDNSVFTHGEELELTIETVPTFDASASVVETVFKGQIVSVEADMMSSAERIVIVRALSKLHLAARETKYRSFINVTISDVLGQLMSECTLQTDIEATTETYEQLDQKNLTNLEFARLLCHRAGLVMWQDPSGKLIAKSAKSLINGLETHVEWGVDLISFRPRVTAGQQVANVEVRGWDIQKKAPITGQSQAAVPFAKNGFGDTVALANKFNPAAKLLLTDELVVSQSSATKLAEAVMAHAGSTGIEAEGLITGDPAVTLGSVIKITNVGERFSGKYVVTGVVHSYTLQDGYQTQFSSHGLQAPLVAGLGSGGKVTPTGTSLTTGEPFGQSLAIAIVTDNVDPRGLGRVKVKFPRMSEEHASWWCRVLMPMAGNERGFQFFPEVNDEVLVGFEHGDLSSGYVLGALWNGKDALKVPTSEMIKSGKVEIRQITTRVGHKLIFSDDASKKFIRIESSDGHYLLIDDSNKLIEIKDNSGNFLKWETGPGNMSFKCSGVFKVDATQDFVVDAMNIKMTAKSNADFKATGSLTAEGTGSATFKSTGSTTLQGTTVSVSGSTSISIRGAIVNIN